MKMLWRPVPCAGHFVLVTALKGVSAGASGRGNADFWSNRRFAFGKSGQKDFIKEKENR